MPSYHSLTIKRLTQTTRFVENLPDTVEVALSEITNAAQESLSALSSAV